LVPYPSNAPSLLLLYLLFFISIVILDGVVIRRRVCVPGFGTRRRGAEVLGGVDGGEREDARFVKGRGSSGRETCD
jgi:hypothetical protein